jgi:hypothetical protein
MILFFVGFRKPFANSPPARRWLRRQASDTEAIRRRIEALPEWCVTDLRSGGVVEELITGTEFTVRACRSTSFPTARWWCGRRTSRCSVVRTGYRSTDNLVDESWIGMRARDHSTCAVIARTAKSTPRTSASSPVHVDESRSMLSCLA